MIATLYRDMNALKTIYSALKNSSEICFLFS